MVTIFEGKTCKAEYLAGKRRVYFSIVGYANVDEHKEMYIKVFQFMQSNKVNSFVHNLKQMKGTFTQLNDWLVETFRPAIELGLKHVAIILNDDVFTAFAADDITKKAKIVQFQVFRAADEAEDWLNSNN